MHPQHSKIMNRTFRDSSFEEDLMSWKLAQTEYQRTSKKTIDEDMLITVLLSATHGCNMWH